MSDFSLITGKKIHRRDAEGAEKTECLLTAKAQRTQSKNIRDKTSHPPQSDAYFIFIAGIHQYQTTYAQCQDFLSKDFFYAFFASFAPLR
jgi:hypothetical protein